MIKNRDTVTQALKVVDDLSIPITVAARVFGVTRKTYYNWKDGGGISNDMMASTVRRITLLMVMAKKARTLPLPPSFEGDQRIEISRILREQASTS